MAETVFTPNPEFMRAAIEAGRYADGVEHPVGAVVVKDGEIISAASNRTHDGTPYHAEQLALAAARIALKARRLTGCNIYSTVEPCTLLCAGEILTNGVANIVYGASAEQAKAFTQEHPDYNWTTGGIPLAEYVARNTRFSTQVHGGLLEDECLELFDNTPLSVERIQSPDGRMLSIKSLIPVTPDRTRVRFTLGETEYDVEAPMDAKRLLAWFPGYVEKARHCISCDELIFPGQGIATGMIESGKSGYSHDGCVDNAAAYAGWLDERGELVTPPQLRLLVNGGEG